MRKILEKEVTKNLTFSKFIRNLINVEPSGTVFFNEDLVTLLIKKFNLDKNSAKKIVNTNLNRLKNENAIKNFCRGVYYKPKNTVFGNSPLNTDQFIYKRYIKNDQEIVGYETGASLLYKMGLTTQAPKYKYITSNNYNKKLNNIDKNLNLILQKPTMEIQEDNYLYLQFLDALENKNKVPIDSNNSKKILNNFIEVNNLNFRKLVAIAHKGYSSKVLTRIGELAEEINL